MKKKFEIQDATQNKSAAFRKMRLNHNTLFKRQTAKASILKLV